ncbi:hypothetical protein [Stenotrophomonas mori]|uniref:Uncharacterized protein n=1 Tax=Stenotrophomonas mori TaxID=2871096 RepID=A0ABT0SFY2_9GAMM|nr:hypothetical protein [Stenotrophomonas mori]MCL7714240.1 hypothetical protein [Stenotrophomonas mori]
MTGRLFPRPWPEAPRRVLAGAATVLGAVLATAPVAAGPPPEAGAVEGGQWRQGTAGGHYRIRVERVGFEHVSCRVEIAWIATAGGRGAPREVDRVPFAEVSNGFWSCGPETVSLQPRTARLTVQATHAYAGQQRTFTALLEGPGRYRCLDCAVP